MSHRTPRTVRRRAALAAAGILVAAALARADDAAPAAPRRAIALPRLVDVDDKEHSFGARADAAPPAPVVLAWTSCDCPMAKVYAPRLRALAADLVRRGVRVILVDSMSTDTVEAIRASRPAAGEGGAGPPIIADPAGDLARLLGARSTTEVFVLAPVAKKKDGGGTAWRIAYRGAVDDQYGYRREAGIGTGTYRKESPSRHYAREAVEAVLSGREPEPASTDPLGCILEWAPVADASSAAAPLPAAGAAPPAFHGGVEPILRRHCQGCHSDGGSAPFALERYAEVRSRARMIREVVSERRMPPWNASPDHGVFANDPTLAPEDMERLLAWVDAGAPRGDAGKALEPLPDASGWRIGKDGDVHIIETPEFEVPAEGSLPYRYVRVPTGFDEDRWVEAAQVISTAPEIVHHVLIFLENVPPAPEGADRPWRPFFNPFSLLEGAPHADWGKWIRRFRTLIRRDLMVGEGGGLNGYFVSSLAGSYAMEFPPGRAKLLPAGATLVFQIHYTPDGARRASKSMLGLRFAPERPREPVDSRAIATVVFEIPPGAPEHRVEATNVLERDALLLSLKPHMHLRGKSFRYVAELPDGGSEILLDVPRYDFDWQLEYELAEPRRLPRGTRLRAIAAFDNSAANPYNPDPKRSVFFGIQTEEEMMIGYYDVVWLETPSPGQ